MIWKGNSSFNAKRFIDKNSCQIYKQHLSIEILQYIEYICYPEMRYLGYQMVNETPDDSFINISSEPFKVERPDFKPNYSVLKENLQYEQKRFGCINQHLTDLEEIIPYFIFEKAFEAYREVI
jgi:hypothetical protein